MTATTGFTSIGAQLKRAGSHIGNTTNFAPSMTADQIDATHLQSTSGFREYKQGYKSGTIAFSGHYDPDNASQDPSTGLLADFISGASATYKADFTTADNAGSGAPSTYGVMTMTCIVTEFSIDAPTGEMVTWSGSLMITGAPSWGSS